MRRTTQNRKSTRAQQIIRVMLVLILGLAGFLLITRSDPVVFQTNFLSRLSQVPEPPFTIFNPFRDHEPERVAHDVLIQLQQGNCGVLSTIERNWPPYCESERKHPLVSWELGDRKDEAGVVSLTFYPYRKGAPHVGLPIVMNVVREGPAWKVTSFNARY